MTRLPFLLALSVFSGYALAQGTFTGVDDQMMSTDVYVNTGTADHQFNLTVTGNDNVFYVVLKDSQGKIVAQFLVESPGNVPVVTVPPGGSVTIKDDSDPNSDAPTGRFTIT